MTEEYLRDQRMLLQELKDLKEAQKETTREITRTRIEVEKLKVKSGVWGAIAGLVSSASIAALSVFR